MITPILVVLFVTALLILSGIVMYNMGRRAIKPSEDFRCLYCGTLVIGAKSLDKMTHILCIDRAPEDIEAMRKSIAPQDDYYWTINVVPRDSFKHEIAFCFYSGSGWMTYQWELYRNGAMIVRGVAKERAVAERALKDEENIDKHKRKAKALNG